MSRPSAPLQSVLLVGLLTVFSTPAHAAEGGSPGGPKFEVDKATLGKRRQVRKEKRAFDMPRRRLAGAKWEIRPSTDTFNADCFYSHRERRFCRDGGFAGAFESTDGKRVLTYSAGSTISSPQEKSIAVFDIESGEKMREVPIPGGGNMTGVADPPHDLFVSFYHEAGGKIVLQAFDMSGNLRWRREFKSRVTTSNGPDSIAITADGRHILLATIPVPLDAASGTILVLSDEGEVKRELAVGSRGIILDPSRTLAAFWNRKGYQLYSVSDDRILLQESCGSGPYGWCLTKGFSPDGRFLAVVSLEEDHRKEKKARVVRVDAVDVVRKKVHRDELNEEVGSNLQVEFGRGGALSVQSSEKTISYEAVP